MTRKQFSSALFASMYFFLILFAYYLLKPLRDSSFLTAFHPHAKPLFNLVTMGILFCCASLYSNFVKVVQGRKFIYSFYGFILLNLIIFRALFGIYPSVTGAIFYTWLSVTNVFWVTIFWTQINSFFVLQQDKVFYIMIGIGGGLGSAFGGKVTEKIVPYIGSDNLILAAIVVLVAAFFCSLALAARANSSTGFEIPQRDIERANFNGLLNEKYAVGIMVLVAVGTFVQSIYDYQLSVLVSETIHRSKDAYSIFYGDLYFKLNSFAFLAQILIGPVVLYSIGPARGMYLFVLLIIGTAVALTIKNSLIVMEWVFIVFAGSGYSVIQIFREQLYVPASQFIKVSCKGFIDTFGFRVGDAFAAIAFVILVSIFNLDLIRLDYLVMVSSLIAAYYLFHINKIYIEITRQHELEIDRFSNARRHEGL